MNRREFVSWVGLGWVASSLPIALAACSSESNPAAQGSSPLPAPATSGGKTTPIGDVAALDQAGFLQGTVDNRPVLVVRNPQVKEQLAAVSAVCTHKGCTLAWKAEQQQFVCPCHGATFALDGGAIQKPAEKPLATYNAKIEGDRVVLQS